MNGDIHKAISFVFGVIGISIFFVFIPIIGFYSILKKETKMFLFAGVELLFFYLFLIISPNLINIQMDFISYSFTELILFFVLFLIYFEVGLKSLNFDFMVVKITQNRTYANDELLTGFNRVFNKYLLYMVIFIFLSYLITYALFQTNILSEFGANLGLKMGSMESIILFTTLAIAGPLLLWLYFSNEEQKNNTFSLFNLRGKVFTKKGKIDEEST
jgi:hypothetical protein